MSRSNPTLTNPATHFFEWSGSKGQLQFYDKEQQKNIKIALPFDFLVLDELATIKGYNKQAESGFWSNEVRNITKDTLFVKTKSGPFEAGLYSTLAQTRSKGGKYAKSIYIAYKAGGEWRIGNIQATGSALSAWIEFGKAHAVETGKVSMKQGEKQQAPTGEYCPPVFEWHKSTPEEDAEAVRLDKELQIYLNQYLAQPKDGEEELEPENFDDLGKATPEQQADYENRRKAAARSRSQKADSEPLPPEPDEVINDFDTEEPINLDDIPFD